ncbi:hypothetical protein RJ55_07094 [Drechmeria coniospora]|nr:hypothetical protein RJ55_07094 [Drechmeria coniospora]
MSSSDEKADSPAKPLQEPRDSIAIDRSSPVSERLQAARLFLDNDEVKTASRDKKAHFLRSKGVDDADIQRLLVDESQSESTEKDDEPARPHIVAPTRQQNPARTPTSSSDLADRAPIVTYPEFLAKPQRPPPLVTTTALLNTLYAFAGLSTLLYGTSKYLVAPMVDSLTDARSDLYETASTKLDALVAKLEKTVSAIPPSQAQHVPDDDISEAEDPTEMFHRDVGTQTSLPPSPDAKLPQATNESGSTLQADRLAALTRTLDGINDQFRTQSDDMDGIRTLLDVFRDDLDGMTFSGQSHFVGGYDMYGNGKRSEPEDEIRKVRDNIRRVKGVLLSTRNFPTSAR